MGVVNHLVGVARLRGGVAEEGGALAASELATRLVKCIIAVISKLSA